MAAGDLPPVALLKRLSDDQIRQLVERVVPQRAPFEGEPWPESDPAFTDYPRRIVEEANRRATRRRNAPPTVVDEHQTAQLAARLESADRQLEQRETARRRREAAPMFDGQTNLDGGEWYATPQMEMEL